MRFRISLLLTAVVLMFASSSYAVNCTAGIVDKAGVIRNTAPIVAAARPLVAQGVDLRIVTVDHNTFVQNGSTLAGVETAFEAACPNLIDVHTGIRKANLFVVMVAPTDRQKNIFLGSYYAGSFDIPSTYSQLANSSFKAGQWETGIANTLNGTGPRAIAYHQQVAAAQQRQRVTPTPPVRAYTATSPTPTYTTPTQTADTGMSGVAIFFLVLFILGVIVTILYFVFRTPSSDTTVSTSSYDPSEFTPTTRASSAAAYSGTRRYAAAAPQTTVVVHDSPRYDSSGNLITGMLIGEALSRNNQPTIINNNPAPVYGSPAPVYSDPTPAAPVVDAPDSTWGDPAPAQTADAPDTNFDTPTQSAPDTTFDTPSDPTPSFESDPSPSFDAPSTDFSSPSGGDSSF
jgi:hypothetical protein